jgi:hypothetical protein
MLRITMRSVIIRARTTSCCFLVIRKPDEAGLLQCRERLGGRLHYLLSSRSRVTWRKSLGCFCGWRSIACVQGQLCRWQTPRCHRTFCDYWGMVKILIRGSNSRKLKRVDCCSALRGFTGRLRKQGYFSIVPLNQTVADRIKSGRRCDSTRAVNAPRSAVSGRLVIPLAPFLLTRKPLRAALN